MGKLSYQPTYWAAVLRLLLLLLLLFSCCWWWWWHPVLLFLLFLLLWFDRALFSFLTIFFLSNLFFRLLLQVLPVVNEQNRYGGEMTGIRSHLTRSIKIKWAYTCWICHSKQCCCKIFCRSPRKSHHNKFVFALHRASLSEAFKLLSESFRTRNGIKSTKRTNHAARCDWPNQCKFV